MDGIGDGDPCATARAGTVGRSREDRRVAVEVKTESKVERLRAQLPALAATGYFNTGTNGPLSLVGQKALVEAATQELEVGRIVPGLYEANGTRNRRVAGVIASILGADADEIALSHSTSEGMAAVLTGATWHRGDEVVTTNLEHPGLIIPLNILAHRHGVVTRYADLHYGEGDVVAQLEAKVTPRTRMIAISHVHWSSGAVMPLKQIAAFAKSRNILTLVDGAQSGGQIAINLHDLGVDAYAVPGQKWFCGPEGTGAFYVRRDRFADFVPSYLRYASFDETGFVIPNSTAQRYEVGEFYGPAVLAQEATLRWMRDEVGLDWMYERTATLGRRLRDAIAAIDGVSVLTPRDRMAGLVNFNVAGLAPKAVSDALYEQGLTIRYVTAHPCPHSARAATGWWNTEEEVDGLAAAIAGIVAAAKAGQGNS